MTRDRKLRLVEACLLFIGLACLGVYLGARWHSRIVQARAARELDRAIAAERVAELAPEPEVAPLPESSSDETECPPIDVAPDRADSGHAGSPSRVTALPRDSAPSPESVFGIPSPDTRDWDPIRRKYHAMALKKLTAGDALGRLDIPSLKLSVVVLEGVDELRLNGGVGHIPGTSAPGVHGNVGLAGHRDGFFRGLGRVGNGDSLRMTTPHGVYDYRVDWTRIVDPKDVSVLAATDTDALTLVTCYPFRVIGSAPQRYIVRAHCVSEPKAAADAPVVAATAPPAAESVVVTSPSAEPVVSAAGP
jgi:LPXTG-site transpeptidase (sortase) family protein